MLIMAEIYAGDNKSALSDCDDFLNSFSRSLYTQRIFYTKGNIFPMGYMTNAGYRIVYSFEKGGSIKCNPQAIMKNKIEANKSGCYIATCVYGSYDCPQVWTSPFRGGSPPRVVLSCRLRGGGLF